ncbi:MAG: hypothetical protein ACPGID_07520 [Rubricella sp.]
MSASPTERNGARVRRRRRRQDGAVLLPIIGVIALMPPVAPFFGGDRQIAGLPLQVVYVFGVWLLLILAARRVARLLMQDEPGRDGR